MSIHADGAAAARIAAGLPEREHRPKAEARSLPQSGPRQLSMNEDELHDLAYHAVTTYLYGISGMAKARAQMHAVRIANAAVTHALASGYLEGHAHA